MRIISDPLREPKRHTSSLGLSLVLVRCYVAYINT
nr:MAG TPA: hypothetical protein [Caudoviricetes sp.]